MKEHVINLKLILFCIAIIATAVIKAQSPATALHFDGSNDNIRGPLVSNLLAGITFEARVKWDGPSLGNKMILYNGTDNANGFGMCIGSNTTSLIIKLGSTIWTSPVNLTSGTMNMISVVVTGAGSVKLYLNGTLVQTVYPPPPPVPSGSFAIGSDDTGNQNFNGTIDEIRYWNRPLCDEEIAHRANCQAIGNEPNLVALYKFNQGINAANNSGLTTVIDGSIYSQNLTLNNFSLIGPNSNWIMSSGSATTNCSYAPQTATINPSGSLFICQGNSITLSATGALSYTWYPGGIISSSITVSPITSTIYSVTALNGNCYSMGVKTVSVNTAPSLTINSSSSSLCIGSSATLSAGGASTYTWLPASTNGSVSVINPTALTVYTLAGTNSNGCLGFITYTQSVIACTSINEFNELNKFYFYPNPCTEKIFFNGEINEGDSVYFINVSGKTVFECVFTNTEIDISSLPAGFYYVKINEKIQQLIKER